MVHESRGVTGNTRPVSHHAYVVTLQIGQCGIVPVTWANLDPGGQALRWGTEHWESHGREREQTYWLFSASRATRYSTPRLSEYAFLLRRSRRIAEEAVTRLIKTLLGLASARDQSVNT